MSETMTTDSHTAAPTADLTAIRYTRDGSGWRVYIRGDWLGRIEQRRVVVVPRTGRKANRWFYSAAAWPWTSRDQTPPTEAMVRTEFGPYPGNGRPDGVRHLLDHLHRHGCPAVAHLYGSPDA